MDLAWQYREICLTTWLFLSSRKSFNDDEIGTSIGHTEATFNALTQLCLLNGLVWLLLIILQAGKKELFYYKRDVTSVVFQNRSPSETFKIISKRIRDSFTQTEARVLKCDLQRERNIHKRKSRRLSRNFTRFRTKLGNSYREIQTRTDNDRQLLIEEKSKFLPLQEVRQDLMLEKDCLIEALRQEIKSHLSLVERYYRCHNVVFGTPGFATEQMDILGSGDFLMMTLDEMGGHFK